MRSSSDLSEADPLFHTKVKTACLLLSIVPLVATLYREPGEPALDPKSLVPFAYFAVAAVAWFKFASWLFHDPSCPARSRLWPVFRTGLVFSGPVVAVLGPAVRCCLPGFMGNESMGPGSGTFLACLFCEFFGVALIEESTKWGCSHPFRPASPRQRLAAGFMAGAAFGLLEGINFSFRVYAGVYDSGAYLVRFVSCVAGHAAWTAVVSVWLMGRTRSSDPWIEARSVCLRLAPIALLHALSNACLCFEAVLTAILLQVGGLLLFGRELCRIKQAEDVARDLDEVGVEPPEPATDQPTDGLALACQKLKRFGRTEPQLEFPRGITRSAHVPNYQTDPADQPEESGEPHLPTPSSTMEQHDRPARRKRNTPRNAPEPSCRSDQPRRHATSFRGATMESAKRPDELIPSETNETPPNDGIVSPRNELPLL
jgi:RsiW-degrading membrane proteinase PrsW (M82 family)